MKLPQLIFFLNVVLVLVCCQQKQKNDTVDESIENIDEAAETKNNLPALEEKPQFISGDSIVAFYNKILGRLYPNRTLSTQYEGSPLTVSTAALENVEGGGMSTKYLRVVDEVDLEIGTIIYETSTSTYPITLSIAILEKGNMLVFPMLTEINGHTVLRVSSNKSGNPDMGPYDYNYFTYNELVNLKSILTKTMVDTEPDLSPLDKESAVKNVTSKEYDHHSKFSKEQIVRIFEGGFLSRYFDENKYQPIIDELKGINKYYVQNDLLKLHSLLKYNNDERYQALENDLSGKTEYPAFINVRLVDNKNGYIKFKRLQTDCEQVMAYWIKDNGDKLIGNTQKCCTMFCEGDITFMIYGKDSQTYFPIATKEIISEIDNFREKKPDNYIEGDGFDYEFILPQKGKDIRYCVEQSCVNLIWQGDIFSVEK